MCRVAFLIVLLFSLAGPVLAQQESHPSERARHLYTTYCQTCHGLEGRGDGPAGKALDPAPRDLTRRPYKRGCGPGAIVGTLKQGVSGSAMPSFEGVLSEDEMWELGRYVRSLQSGCCQQR